MEYTGVVVDNKDDLFEGRIRVRVFGKHDERVNNADASSEFIIPNDALPWARNGNLIASGGVTGSGSFSVPKVGSIVRIEYEDNNEYAPIYYNCPNISDEVRECISKAYPNAHILIYDTAFGCESQGEFIMNKREGESIKVYFTEADGFVIEYTTKSGPTHIVVNPSNGVNIKNPNGDEIDMGNDGKINIHCSSVVNVDCKEVNLGDAGLQKMLKAETFQKIFNAHTHPVVGVLTGEPLIELNDLCLSKKVKNG